METDQVIDQWLASLPDFDEQEQAVAIEAILNDPAFGESRKSRIERLKFARYAATIANFVAIAFFFVEVPFFLPTNVPRPAVITIIAAMPFLSVMAIIMSKGLYSVRRLQTIFRYRRLHIGVFGKYGLPDLSAVLVLPSFLLLFSGFVGGPPILDWWLAILVVFAAGIAVTLFLVWMRMRRPVFPVIIIIPAVMWSSGLVLHSNYLCDTSTPSIYRTVILNMRETTGDHPEYYIKISPWGPQTKEHEFSVTPETYNTYRGGAELCVYVHKGALGIPWWDFDICSNSPSNSSPHPPVRRPALKKPNFIRPQ
jgi:hypothetical protein